VGQSDEVIVVARTGAGTSTAPAARLATTAAVKACRAVVDNRRRNFDTNQLDVAVTVSAVDVDRDPAGPAGPRCPRSAIHHQ
jgi:hypothetical protein